MRILVIMISLLYNSDQGMLLYCKMNHVLVFNFLYFKTFIFKNIEE